MIEILTMAENHTLRFKCHKLPGCGPGRLAAQVHNSPQINRRAVPGTDNLRKQAHHGRLMMILEILDEIRHDEALAFSVKKTDFTKTTDPRDLDLLDVRREVRQGFGSEVAPWNAGLFNLATLPQTGRCPCQRVGDAGFPVVDETPVRAVRRHDMPDGPRLSIVSRRLGS